MPSRSVSSRGTGRRDQRGAALILFATVLILGVAWFTVGALGGIAPTTADREARTGLALNAAKKALLAYVALKAADSTENFPGRLPCPESLSQPGTAADGVSAPVVAPSFPTCSSIGRLPWETLGIDQLRDGYGEPLWYAVTTGTWALVNSGTSLTINPGTANTITYNNPIYPTAVPPSVVAVIIAPGRAVNTLSEPGTPPAGCAKVNQQTNRYAVPYVVTKFLECGNAIGDNYTTAGTAPWSNDRTISVTATEVMDAIAGAVADRLQRQVAPTLNDWRTTQSLASWGQSFLPFASTFTTPTSNNMCGDQNIVEGMLPTATIASGTCGSPNWISGSASGLGGLLNLTSCNTNATRIRCDFTVILGGLVTPTFTATAQNIAYAFRSFSASQVTIAVPAVGGVQQPATIQNLTGSINATNGHATISFQIPFPLLSIGNTVRVRITNPVDAALLTDAKMKWFLNNDWDRYTYYAVSQAATVNPSLLLPCTAPGDAGCLTVSGLPALNGNTNDKRFILTLMGRAVTTGAGYVQSQPSANPVDYLESHTAGIGSKTYSLKTVSSTFNDRQAACPFQQTAVSGPVSICN